MCKLLWVKIAQTFILVWNSVFQMIFSVLRLKWFSMFWWISIVCRFLLSRLSYHHVNKVENLLNIKNSLLSCFTALVLQVYKQQMLYFYSVVVQGCHFSLITVAGSEAWTCKIVKILQMDNGITAWHYWI